MGRILLSMTKIQPDDILEVLFQLRTRESEKLKTVLELYDLETHQKKLGPDYHRLKAMVKRSIEQDWQWETNGQCVKGNNCIFRHDMNKRGKSSPSNPSQNSFMRQSERDHLRRQAKKADRHGVPFTISVSGPKVPIS